MRRHKVPAAIGVAARLVLAVLAGSALTGGVAAQVGAQADGMAVTAAAHLEGRPAPQHQSPLQARVDAAAPGARLEIAAGTYAGDLVLDRPIHLVGIGRPVLQGSRQGSVVRIRANDVTIEGFDIDGQGGGRLVEDAAGIHVAGERAVVRDNHIVRSIFGIYLREANGAIVDHNTVRGDQSKDPGDQGSAIHVWNTQKFRITDNNVRYSRDGFYVQASGHGFIARNVASDLRYGLHYMFSDDNVFEDNTFERGAAGAALMYSKRITFRRNQFIHNRGFASVGLLLKACDDILAEDNLIGDNARGVFVEGSYRDVFRRNIIAGSDSAIVLYDSAHEIRFEDNAFYANLTPLQLVGRRTDTVFDRNYWSESTEPDLDGDGVRDRPFRLTSVFDHLRGNLTAADLFAESLAASALGIAEESFPVLTPIPVLDAHPLARPPTLGDVPRPPLVPGSVARSGVFLSGVLLAAGVMLLSSSRSAPARWSALWSRS